MSRCNDARLCRLKERHLRAFTTETTGELNVLGLNGDTVGTLVDVKGKN